MTKYGLPYMGNKSKIISKISEYLPSAENFYDLFGGGGAVSHFMVESGKYKSVHYNEILKPVAQCFEDATNGKYNPKVFTPKWITREEFHEKKDIDGYVRTCWSFGNRGITYLLGKHIENEKRSMHQSVVFGEFDEWFISTFKMDSFPVALESIKEKRLYLKRRIRELYPDCGERYMVNGKSLQQLQQLEQLERLQQLEQLQHKAKITCTRLDYRLVPITDDSIIYCDIPYRGTAKYSDCGFDHDAFYAWAKGHDHPIFISEYTMPEDGFYLVTDVDHRSVLSPKNNNKAVKERMYCNKVALQSLRSVNNGN